LFPGVHSRDGSRQGSMSEAPRVRGRKPPQ
jgi:hypothetical protein